MEVILTARLGASRLPRKHIRKILHDRTSIDLLLERLLSTEIPVVVAVPGGDDERPLIAEISRHPVAIFRGDPENVLLRYRQTFEERGLTEAVIVDADDYFVSLSWIRRLAAEPRAADVVRVSHLPFGGAPYILSRAAVDRLLAAIPDSSGWGAKMDRVLDRIETRVDERFTTSERAYRLSLDYEEDLAFARRIYERVYRGAPIGLGEAVAEISANIGEYRRDFAPLFDGSLESRHRAHLGPS